MDEGIDKARTGLSAEMYVEYGIAMYQAQVLEFRVAQLLGVALTADKKFGSQDELDQAHKANQLVTLGMLMHRLVPHIDGTSLLSELRAALATRNNLAHAFFGAHEANMETPAGQDSMIDEALAAQHEFHAVMRSMIPVLASFLDTIGAAPDDHIPGLGEKIQLLLSNQRDIS